MAGLPPQPKCRRLVVAGGRHPRQVRAGRAGTDALYLLSFRDAPHGKVLRLPLTSGTTVADADEIVPAGDTAIEDLAVTRGTVWVVDSGGGPQQVRAFDGKGGPLPPVEIPPMSSVSSYSARLSALGEGPDRLVAGVLHRAGDLVG